MDKSTDAWVAMELSGADAHSPRKNSDDVQMALAFSGRLPNVNSQAAPKVSDHAVTNTVDAHSEFTVDGDSDVTECRASTLGTSRSKSSQRGWLTRRWWASKAHALSKSPVGVAAILVLMCLMIGLGVWGVIAGSNQAANREREAAFIVASEKAMNLKNVFNAAYGPALAVATMIRNNPLNLTSLSAQFEGAVADAMALEQTKPIFNMQIVPNGKIARVIPLEGFECSPGLDLLECPCRSTDAFKAIRSRNLFASGPAQMNLGGWFFVGLNPIFVKDVDVDETFNFPDTYGVPNAGNAATPDSKYYNATYLRGSGRGIYDLENGRCPEELCYIQETRSKFWGFSKSVVSWEWAKNEAHLYLLCDAYDFIMTHEWDGKKDVPIAMCSDKRMVTVPRGKSGMTFQNGTIGRFTLADYMARDPVSVTFGALQSEWTLHVVSTHGGRMVGDGDSSWVPGWKCGLTIGVVLASLLFAFLLLLLLATHVEQSELLDEQAALMDQKDELLGESRRARAALELEKKHTDVLIMRQLNLISCFASSDTLGCDELMSSNAAQLGSMEVSTLQRIEVVRRLAATSHNLDEVKIDETQLLGEGAFGKVYKGVWHGTEVAIKTIVLPSNMSGIQKHEHMAIMEAAISTSMSHPNIVQTFTYSIKPICDASESGQRVPFPQQGIECADVSCLDTDSPNTVNSMSCPHSVAGLGQSRILSYEVRLVLEFCDLGSLRDALDRDTFLSDVFNYWAVLDVACDVAKAMVHLHAVNVLHSDLKARNIMMQTSGKTGSGLVAKIADFGLAMSLDHNQTHVSGAYQGTMTHMAPEVLLEGKQSKAADVYSFGITLWELFTQGHAFQSEHRAHLGHAITVGKLRPQFGLAAPAAFKALAEQCWAEDPNARPTFHEALTRLEGMRRAHGGTTPPLPIHKLSTPLPLPPPPPPERKSLSPPERRSPRGPAARAPAADAQEQQQQPAPPAGGAFHAVGATPGSLSPSGGRPGGSVRYACAIVVENMSLDSIEE